MLWLLGVAVAAPLGDGTLPVGATLDISHHVKLDLALEVRVLGVPRAESIRHQHDQRYRLTRLPDGVELQWRENRHQVDQPGHQHDKELPVVGHRYRTHPTPTRDGGITKEEADIVGQVQTLEMLEQLRSMLPEVLEADRQFAAGPLFAGILDPAPGEPELVGGTLTVHDQTTSEATLLVSAKLRSTGLDGRGALVTTELDLQGTLVIDVASGLTRRFEVSGPITLTASRDDLHTTGAGQFSSLTTLEPR